MLAGVNFFLSMLIIKRQHCIDENFNYGLCGFHCVWVAASEIPFVSFGYGVFTVRCAWMSSRRFRRSPPIIPAFIGHIYCFLLPGSSAQLSVKRDLRSLSLTLSFSRAFKEQCQFKILLDHEQLPSLDLPNWWLWFDTIMWCKQISVAVQLEHHLAAHIHTHPLTTAPLTVQNSKFRISGCCYYEVL